ncbi:hypothetical protein C7T35_21260 [Variovorax sp. WS11]|uniref:YciI family protein n=1 Tax=Variovorax sp. WS11 TaxID=1105204 RepID=UPI000D0E18AD|nr:YciI family protein [Variovorax sp. WS11]NDZ18760.1 YciI family protein [Variovorax sp. WS11]PSL82539.1 hypothetical protein C7T35_21260 [Variovorax sp. WS11]
MIYTFILLDKANAQDLRRNLKADHRTYITKVADRIAFAGRLVGDDGRTKIGSLIAIDFPSREAATEWLQNEPFTREGLYASIQIQAFVNLWPQKAGFPPPLSSE